MKNPVAKHLNTFNKPSVEPCKAKALRSNATLRDAREIVSEGLFDSETMCFDGMYDASCNGCLNDVGCSSASIDAFEDNY